MREASGSNGTLAVHSSPVVPIPTPTPEQLLGKDDALGENQHYQSIHDGAFREYNPTPWPGVGSGPRPTLSGGLFNGYIDGKCISTRFSTFPFEIYISRHTGFSCETTSGYFNLHP